MAAAASRPGPSPAPRPAVTMACSSPRSTLRSAARCSPRRSTTASTTVAARGRSSAGARPLLLLARGAAAEPAHAWYRDFDLPRERERGLDHVDEHLHAATFRATLQPGAALTLVLSAEPAPDPDGETAWARRARHESDTLSRWTRARPEAKTAPAWIRHLVLAADQFVVRRPLPDDPDGATVIAGYHWFGDWGRDTMIALPGLTLAAGQPGVQLTWMDAKVGDWVVTPRIGKPVEINALWYNALVAMAGFARRLRRPAEELDTQAARVATGFERFWNRHDGWCFDVLDGPDGNETALRPNQILAVSLPASALPPARRRAVVDACARHLLTSYGLRSLAPFDARYVGRYGGDQRARDGAYHQGTAWGWLLGPFALAHFNAYGDAARAREYLAPLADHLGDHGLGSIAEIFDGDAPFLPNGCIAQAWSVAETLRAWQALGAPAPAPRAPSRRPRLS